jgi:TolA-binding protein
MKTPRFLTTLLALFLLVSGLAGCSSSSSAPPSSSAPSSSGSSSPSASSSQDPGQSSEEPSAGPNLAEQEHLTLNIMMFGDGDSAEVDLWLKR